MSKITLDIAEFRSLYPSFADETKYPDTSIQNAFNMSEVFLDNNTNCLLDGSKLKTVLYLMLAHLLQAEANASGGVVTSATIDKISVTIADPASKNEFQYFLNQTPYGQQLLALFKVLSMGGFYVGGRAETLAFRKVNGAY